MSKVREMMQLAARTAQSTARKVGIVDRAGRDIVKKQPTVMIGLIMSEFVPSDFAVAFGTLCASPGYPIALSARVPDMNFPQPLMLNDIVHTALDAGTDYILFLNSDVLIPQSAIHELVQWDREIIGAVYKNKVPPFNLICATADGQPQNVTGGVVEMGTIPMGCTLIKTDVFRKMPHPWFHDELGEGGGITPAFVRFCNNARAAGFKVWADITLSGKVGRLGKNIFMNEAEYGEPRVAGPAAEKAA